MIYQWKTIHYNVDAQEAGEELERIEAKTGAITAQNVVEESRPEKAKLHSCFEWDNDTAAEKYREQQARVLIGNLIIVQVQGCTTEKPVRAFVHVSNTITDKREYKPIDVVLSEKAYTQQMLKAAMEELDNFHSKYQSLSELAEVFAAISETKRKMSD